MAKKLLCVVLSVLMVVSLLPVGIMADSTDGLSNHWVVAFCGFNSSWNGWSGVSSDTGVLEYTTTVQELMDANGITDLSDFGGFQAQVWNMKACDEDATFDYEIYINDVLYTSGSTSVENNGYNASTIYQLNSSNAFSWGEYEFASTSDEIKAVVSNVTYVASSVSYPWSLTSAEGFTNENEEVVGARTIDGLTSDVQTNEDGVVNLIGNIGFIGSESSLIKEFIDAISGEDAVLEITTYNRPDWFVLNVIYEDETTLWLELYDGEQLTCTENTDGTYTYSVSGSTIVEMLGNNLYTVNGVTVNAGSNDASATVVKSFVVDVPEVPTVESGTVVASQTTTGTLTILDGADFTNENLYLYINYEYIGDTSSDYVNYDPAALCDTSWNGIVTVTSYNSCGGTFVISLVDLATAFGDTDVTEGVILNFWGTNYAVFTNALLVDTSTTSSSSYRTNDFIYVNEEYHALLVYRNNRRYFVTVPHTVDSNGYCTVCHMYIGTDDDETSTATVDGVEYEVAYSEDVNLAASGWGTYEFADNSIIDALATDGALLVITRSEATDVVYDSDAGTYEKLGLVDSWWVGDWIRLGTAGHTDADEADDTIIDCMSDDGTTIIYDGATVYAAWVAAGMDNGGTATLITNTSGTYTITNVAVYVPAGTITAEDVTVDEPAEEGDTDDEEDMNVDDGDEAEAETPAETNPTTGAVLALVPMAIAGLAVVASKRK